MAHSWDRRWFCPQETSIKGQDWFPVDHCDKLFKSVALTSAWEGLSQQSSEFLTQDHNVPQTMLYAAMWCENTHQVWDQLQLLQSVDYLSLIHSQIMTEDLPRAKQSLGLEECIGSVSNVVMLKSEVNISREMCQRDQISQVILATL